MSSRKKNIFIALDNKDGEPPHKIQRTESIFLDGKKASDYLCSMYVKYIIH